MVLIGETPVGQELMKLAFATLELKRLFGENEDLSFLLPEVEKVHKISNHITNEVVKAQIKELEEL